LRPSLDDYSAVGWTETGCKSMTASTVAVVPGGPVHGTIRPPGSKSLTNRALICAAFADGPSRLTGALRSEDTSVMIAAMRQLGIPLELDSGCRDISITPTDQRSKPIAPIEIYVGNSGTTIRFLTAALAARGGRYRLHGVDRMHQRPIGDLVEALTPAIEGSIDTSSAGGCPPVQIDSRDWKTDKIDVAGNISSQYLSGLMMAGPIACSTGGLESLTIGLRGALVSRPYVEMTAAVMRAFGAVVQIEDEPSLTVRIDAQPYQGTEYEIEPDASAASYFWAAAAITGGKVTVEGLSNRSLQGDVAFSDVLKQMGCDVNHGANSITVAGKPLHGIDVDMNVISDTVQTLAVVALFANGPTRIRGVAHNRFKETDRIGDLAHELTTLGARVEQHDDGLTIQPPDGRREWDGATLHTYDDHRMAMSLALAGLRMKGVKISDPACTAKTYPEYFTDLEHLLGRPHRWASQ